MWEDLLRRSPHRSAGGVEKKSTGKDVESLTGG